MKKQLVTVAGFGAVACVSYAAFVAAQEFEITRSTIDGGGIMRSASGKFEASGTIGQPDAGVMTGGDFELYGGFWFPLSPGDCDEDGGVTLFDYQPFEICLTGPGEPLPADCICFDLDRNGFVDLLDVARLQTGFSGR